MDARQLAARQVAAARTAQYRNKDAHCNICTRFGHVDENRAWELAEMEASL